jgi:hypothetical protein
MCRPVETAAHCAGQPARVAGRHLLPCRPHEILRQILPRRAMKRSVVAQYLLSVTAGAGFLLATTIEVAAKKYALQCEISASRHCEKIQTTYGPRLSCCAAITNTSGPHIPWPTRIEFTFCNDKVCWQGYAEAWGPSGLAPGERHTYCWGFFPRSDTRNDAIDSGDEIPRTCSANVDIPEMFRERPKPSVKEYWRTRPPSPPQPGLLENSPGFSRQSPSSVGTPKPSAPPPPSISRDSFVR